MAHGAHTAAGHAFLGLRTLLPMEEPPGAWGGDVVCPGGGGGTHRSAQNQHIAAPQRSDMFQGRERRTPACEETLVSSAFHRAFKAHYPPAHVEAAA